MIFFSPESFLPFWGDSYGHLFFFLPLPQHGLFILVEMLDVGRKDQCDGAIQRLLKTNLA